MANIEKYKELARKFELKEQWAKAVDPLLKAIEEFEKAPDNESDLALYNRVGDLYSKLNDTTNAIQYYDRAVDRYSEAGLVNNAIALCNKVLRLSPGRVHSYLKLGTLFAKKGFMAEAKQNLLEYADRMQKAGQIEEAFRALKKFAEMTPGQDEMWKVLAQQARAQAKTPEQQEQVENLLSEFEAKEKAQQQRKSRASRSMITGEEIPEEAPSKKGELIFLDIDDVPTPGRKSGAMAAPKAPAPPPPPPPPPPPAPPPPPPPVEPEPAEVAPLELEPMVSDSSLGLEPTSLDIEPASIEVEPLSIDRGIDVEPTALDADVPGLELEPTSLAEPPSLESEPTASPDFGTIDLEPAGLSEPESAPGAELPLLDFGEAGHEPPGAELPMLEPAPEPEGLPYLDAEVGAVAEVPGGEPWDAEAESAPVEFEDLGSVAEPTAPGIPELEARIAADPNDWEGHRLLGEALLASGERDRGLAELDLSLDGYDQSENLDEAASLVEEILRIDSNSVRHQQKRVELSYRSGDRARLVDAYVELADALVRTDDVEKAIAVYQRVIEHDPDNDRARLAIETLAPPAEQVPPARRSAVAAPPPAAGDYVDLGSFLLDDEDGPKDTRMRIEDEEPTGDEQKDFQQMLAAFKKGIEANVEDTDFQSHYDLGVAYKEMGLLDEAIGEFQKALRSSEGRLKSSEALGLCFFEKGQFAICETILKRGLELPASNDADRIGLLYWLGRTLEELERPQDALAAYNRVYGVDINFQDTNQRVKALKRAGA